MLLLQIVVLAAVQGITEFLPISSSAHLILVPHITGWPDQGLMMDVAMHVGTLLAVCVYMYKDLRQMTVDLIKFLRGRRNVDLRVLGLVIWGTLPVIFAGYYFHKMGWVDQWRSIKIIGWTSLGFGVLLYIADQFSVRVKFLKHMTKSGAFFVGLFQILSLIPGTSRSGITVTAARMLGYERSEAVRFSLLLSIPTILGAGVLKGRDLVQSGDLALQQDVLMAAGLSFLFALMAIAMMMRWLRKNSFTPFVFYRVVLGAGLLALAYGVV